MSNDPWTGARLGSNSDSPLGGSYLAELVNEVGKWTSPGFPSTAARDSAFTAWQANGNTPSDGMRCTCAGVPYRLISGTWRVAGDRGAPRSVTPTAGSAANTIVAGGAAETGATSGAAALGNIVLYEAKTLILRADFRVNPTVAAICSIKVDGAVVGAVPGVTRTDVTCQTGGTVTLAPGIHVPALRVDTNGGGSAVWTNAQLQWWEAIGE